MLWWKNAWNRMATTQNSKVIRKTFAQRSWDWICTLAASLHRSTEMSATPHPGYIWYDSSTETKVCNNDFKFGASEKTSLNGDFENHVK